MKALVQLGILAFFAVQNVALADRCSVEPMYEQARKECAAQNAASCFMFTTLHDNKDQWSKIEEVCRNECKGNPEACTQYQTKGLNLINQRCVVDPDACAARNAIQQSSPRT